MRKSLFPFKNRQMIQLFISSNACIDIPNVVRSKSPATPLRGRRAFLPHSSRATTPGSTLPSPGSFSVSSFRRSSLTRLTENLTVFAKPKTSKLQESLGNAVNDLVKALHFYQQNVSWSIFVAQSFLNDDALFCYIQCQIL